MDFFGNDINANDNPILKRTFMFLEEGDWERANEFCEQILDQDPENAWAYLAKLMIETKVKTREELLNLTYSFENSINYKRCIRYGNEELKKELIGYIEYIKRKYGSATVPTKSEKIQPTTNAQKVSQNTYEQSFSNDTQTDIKEYGRKKFYLTILSCIGILLLMFAFMHFIEYYYFYRGYYVGSADFYYRTFWVWLIPIAIILWKESANYVKRVCSLGGNKATNIFFSVMLVGLVTARMVYVDIDYIEFMKSCYSFSHTLYFIKLHKEITGSGFTVGFLIAPVYILVAEIYAKKKKGE